MLEKLKLGDKVHSLAIASRTVTAGLYRGVQSIVQEVSDAI